ncbi:MAG TPA: NUDIX hydrolase [Opitutaceae bacterium]|jgi:8-oxo-dGTP pyrophosphatase MutT (NUDIX family)
MAEPERWIRGPERTLASTRIFDLRSVAYRHPKREAGREFVMIASPDWVNVIALTTDERIVLVRQFRIGIDDFSWEVPGGIIDSGEDPVAAGVRELREETGHGGARARLLASVHPNPAIMNNRCHFVLVEQAWNSHPLEWDHDEELETLTVPVEETFAWARAGRITHSLSVCALMHFEGWYRAGKPPAGAVV